MFPRARIQAGVALLLALAISSPATAQELASVLEQTPDRCAEASIRDAAHAWFCEYIEPALHAEPPRNRDADRNPVLYESLERGGRAPGATPEPAKPLPERTIWIHRAQLGPVGAVVLAGDLPQPRGDWNDTIQPEMFRLYFESVPPPPKPRPVPVPGA